jgi:hypothetical protein
LAHRKTADCFKTNGHYRPSTKASEEDNTMINFQALAKMPEAEISKMVKSELVAAILRDRHMFDYYKKKVEELQEQIAQNTSNERAACVVLAAFIGLEIPKDGYSNQIDTRQLNILELVGLVTAKCASY